MKTVAALVMMFAAVPAGAADQFDLLCTGAEKASARGPATPIETRYRVDLATKSWCRNDCAEVKAIQSVEPGKIVFEQHDRTHDDDIWVRHMIDRTTGEWEDFYVTPGMRIRLIYSPGIWRETHGSCASAPYSGMPSAKF